MLEDEIEGRLYKTVWLDDGKVSFSVSRVNKYLSYYFVVFWVLVTLYVAWKYARLLCISFAGPVAVAAGITVIVGVGIVLLLGQTTDLSRGTLPKADRFPGDDLQVGCPKLRWPKLRWCKHIRGANPQNPFIRRKAPDEP